MRTVMHTADEPASASEQFQQMASGSGFIAALDQSGGSTPRALRAYGVESWADESEMFDLVHAMRTRILTSPSFGGHGPELGGPAPSEGGRVIGAILFDRTMESEIAGLGAAEYLWQVKKVVPFLKVDQGLQDESDGTRLMKPMPRLDDMLSRAQDHQVFGTKMRSLVTLAHKDAIGAVVDQQLSVALHILDRGLVPIVEPEVDIHSPEKAQAEDLLRDALVVALDGLRPEQQVMLKLTLPEEDGLWTPLVEHPRVLRVAALSGGYSRAEAVAKLACNPGVIASFSRALTEGLRVDQSDEEFDMALDESIEAIYHASLT
ncbi:fructose bisphosphate aldolase [Isoptericola sp. b490]|uniref:fructose bisphosphate aldolase n=1 Tax=Actinotalea lenta TaxID=3064654 RepID=UPI002713B0F3|nr:fructose bisphosphate aldolase [Isoptericola sp. b490]MDO8121289.1 fructose bisphosphate aldolase [Isoptericola sp. b490]